MEAEEQKKAFIDGLNTILNENILRKETTYSKYSQWLENLYSNYINNSLPEEHIEVLEQKLKKRNITIEEFLETKGNLDLFIKLYTDKKNPNNKGKENIIKDLRDENQKLVKEKEKIRLKSSETINTLNQEIKSKNNEIKDLHTTIERQKKQIESKENNCKKLRNEIEVKDSIISSLNTQIKDRDKTIISSDQKISYFQREVEAKDLEMKKLKNEISVKKDTKKIKAVTKKHILKLLCDNDTITLQKIKDNLISANIPIDDLLDALNELRYEIPGIMQNINPDGKSSSYAIRGNATQRIKELQNMNFCPSLSNIYDGKIECLLVADLHLKGNTLDSMKRKFEPCFNLCSTTGNTPIINFGDIQDSIHHMQNNRNLSDKDVIRYTYTFWENYAKVIATCPKIEHFTEFGNREEEIFYRGIDPIEIINNNCNNFTFLGINQGAINIGNDKIGIYHKLNSIQSNNITDSYNRICEEAKNIIKDNIYFFMGHIHIGRHNPLLGFSLIGNGVENALHCTIEVKDGSVEKIYLNRLILQDNKKYHEDEYQTEVYNKNSYQYLKQ